MIGGTQGGQVVSLSLLQIAVTATLQFGANASSISSADKKSYAAALLPLLQQSPIALYPSTGNPSVNFLDNIASGDKQGVPLQFLKGPVAECRIWYVAKDMVDVENTWQRVASGVKQGGQGLCVGGSLKGKVSATVSEGGGNGNATRSRPAVGPSSSSTTAFTGAAGATSSASVGAVVVAIVVVEAMMLLLS